MLSVQGIKSVFCRRKNPDRVYMMEDKRKPRNFLSRSLRALGLKPRKRKYNPNKFDHISGAPLAKIQPQPVVPTKVCSYISLDTDDSDFEDELDLEIIDVEVDVPRDDKLGDQEEPEPLIIAFEYPEEEMPVWFHLGYGCDPPEVEFSWLRFFGFKSDHFV